MMGGDLPEKCVLLLGFRDGNHRDQVAAVSDGAKLRQPSLVVGVRQAAWFLPFHRAHKILHPSIRHVHRRLADNAVVDGVMNHVRRIFQFARRHAEKPR